jgi:hypothetical protein
MPTSVLVDVLSLGTLLVRSAPALHEGCDVPEHAGDGPAVSEIRQAAAERRMIIDQRGIERTTCRQEIKRWSAMTCSAWWLGHRIEGGRP